MTDLLIAIYLDLALCAGLGTIALFISNDDATYNEFYEGWNILSTTVALCSLLVTVLFPFYIHYTIKSNFNNLEDPNVFEKHGSLYGEMNTKSYMAAQYNFYAIMRRLIMTIIMLLLRKRTLLQVNLYIVMSIMNLGYLFQGQLFLDKKVWLAEISNEVCVGLCSYIHYQFMLTSSSEDEAALLSLKNKNGWFLIGFISFNILFNILLVSYDASVQIYQVISSTYYAIKLYQDNKIIIKNKMAITNRYGDGLWDIHIKKEEEAHAIAFCKDFHEERKWCFENKLDYRKLPEEA